MGQKVSKSLPHPLFRKGCLRYPCWTIARSWCPFEPRLQIPVNPKRILDLWAYDGKSVYVWSTESNRYQTTKNATIGTTRPPTKLSNLRATHYQQLFLSAKTKPSGPQSSRHLSALRLSAHVCRHHLGALVPVSVLPEHLRTQLLMLSSCIFVLMFSRCPSLVFKSVIVFQWGQPSLCFTPGFDSAARESVPHSVVRVNFLKIKIVESRSWYLLDVIK